MDGCAQEVILHLVSRGLHPLGCSRISIPASFFFSVCPASDAFGRSHDGCSTGATHIYMPGIKYDAFGHSHGWLRNMGCHQACLADFVPGCQSRDHGSTPRSAKIVAQPHLSSTRRTCSSQASMLEKASFNQAPWTSTEALPCGVSGGRAGGQGGCEISILLGSTWNLPLVWKSASGHARGAGGSDSGR